MSKNNLNEPHNIPKGFKKKIQRAALENSFLTSICDPKKCYERIWAEVFK